MNDTNQGINTVLNAIINLTRNNKDKTTLPKIALGSVIKKY